MNISWDTALLVFGLKDNFTQNELKTRYRSLSKITHPDTGGDENLFKFITACKEVLENNKDTSSNSSNQKRDSSYTSKQSSKETTNIKLRTLYDIIYDLNDYTDKYDIQIIHTQIDITVSSRRKMNNMSVNLYKHFNDFIEAGFVKFPTTVIEVHEPLGYGKKLKVEVILFGEKYKFKITRKKKFHTLEYSRRNLTTFIPFEFKVVKSQGEN